jgi:hypothetical protein
MTVVRVENPSPTDVPHNPWRIHNEKKPMNIITVGKPLAIPHPSHCM